MTHATITTLIALIGALTPFLTGLVAKEKSQTEKAVTSALVSALAASLTTYFAQPSVSWLGWFVSIGVSWASAIIAYHGFWQPTGIVDRWVEWGAKQLTRIGIHLPQKEEEDIVQWLHTILGDAVEFLTEEEARHRFGGPTPPAAPANITNIAGPIPPLKGPGHNFTNEGAA